MFKLLLMEALASSSGAAFPPGGGPELVWKASQAILDCSCYDSRPGEQTLWSESGATPSVQHKLIMC